MKLKSISTFLLWLSSFPILACWSIASTEQLVEESQVVVEGEIVAIDRDVTFSSRFPTEEKQVFDIAHIKVNSLLRDTLQEFSVTLGGELPLAMPAESREEWTSVDLVYRLNQSGIWILKHHKDGYFLATHPGDFQPLDQLAKIQTTIDEIDKVMK